MYLTKVLKHNIVKETFIYTATDMIGKAMAFLLLPVVSYYMPPAELGIASNFTVLAQLVILLAGSAIVNSLPYFFYEQDKNENKLLVSNLLLLCIITCLVLAILILLLGDLVIEYLQLSIKIQLLSIIFVLGNLLSQMNLVLLRLENRAKHFACLQILQILLHTLMVVLFVIILRGGGVGKIYAEVLVFALMGFVHLVILCRKGYLKNQIEKRWIKKLLIFGLPLMPHSVSFWLKGGMDKVFITSLCGLQFNGLYSMSISISSLYTMLVNSFFGAYTPYLQKKLSELKDNCWNEKIFIVRQTYLLYFLFSIIGILTVLGSWGIFEYVLDKKYLQGFVYMPFIILANFIYSFYHFTVQYIFKVKKTLVMGIITFTGSLFQMLLSYYMIKFYGVMGAVYSMVIGNAIVTICITLYSNKVYPMPWLSFINKDTHNSFI